METTTKLINQEVIDLISNEELKKVLSDILRKYESLIELSFDGRQEGDVSEISVFSECFEKNELKVLFQFCYYYDAVVYNKKRGMMVVHLDVEL
jgi:hypothetical protein